MSEFLKVGYFIELTDEHEVYYHGVRVLLSSYGFRHLRGEYVVTNARMTPADKSYDDSDVLPDGMLIVCESVCGKYSVSFYQSGVYSLAMRDIRSNADG